MSLKCKNCSSSKYIKNGFVGNIQRYKCKNCGYNYKEGDKRQKYTVQDRFKVLKLYLENCGIRSIERLTGVCNSQVLKWISESADTIKQELSKCRNEINSIKDISILKIDELCTYINKDQKIAENSLSYGLLLIGTEVKLLILK